MNSWIHIFLLFFYQHIKYNLLVINCRQLWYGGSVIYCTLWNKQINKTKKNRKNKWPIMLMIKFVLYVYPFKRTTLRSLSVGSHYDSRSMISWCTMNGYESKFFLLRHQNVNQNKEEKKRITELKAKPAIWYFFYFQNLTIDQIRWHGCIF